MSNKITEKLVLPSTTQEEWADAEIGVIIHYDIQAFEPDYSIRRQWGYTPDPGVFNPTELNTDQWIETAKSAGAKYAVLVAKHCSGFSLWPTKAHDYSVKSSPWKNGKGDIVDDFIKSCAKFNIKPGIYASASCNGYMRADNPGKVLTNDPKFLKKYNSSLHMQSGNESIWAGPKEQLHYNKVVETQLMELWKNYGKLFEIWFDGGVLPPEQGGPDLVPIMHRLQPAAVVFGGPDNWPSLVRFIGNERADTPDPFWSTTDNLNAHDGTRELSGLGGCPGGSTWAPGEADMPNRGQHNALWFWREGEDTQLHSVEHLTECYLSSVGRNTNLLLGMVIDNRGLVPEADQKQFREFGKRIQDIFSKRLDSITGVGNSYLLELSEGQSVNMIMLQEDIAQGERVRKYVVEAKSQDSWLEVCRGTCIGHKRIERLNSINATKLRLRILESAANPQIREFSAWNISPNMFNVGMDPVKRSKPKISRGKDGMVRIICSNPNLQIKYTINGSSEPESIWAVYDKPIPFANGGEVKAFAFVNKLSRSEIVSATFGVDRRDWTVVSVSLDSPFENLGHAGVKHLLNDDIEFYWHTYHSEKNKRIPPHEVVLDMKRNIEVQAFTLMPRDSETMPEECEFYLSDDGKSWKLAAHAEFKSSKENSGMKLINLKKTCSGRFLRLLVKHTPDYVVVAGLGVVIAKNKKEL